MDSEPALQRNYADLTMIVRPDYRKFDIIDILIEFKYISLTDAKLTSGKAKESGSLAQAPAGSLPRGSFGTDPACRLLRRRRPDVAQDAPRVHPPKRL